MAHGSAGLSAKGGAVIKRLPIFGGPSLREQVASVREAVAREYPPDFPLRRLVDYLRQGHLLEAWMGGEACVLDQGHFDVGSMASLTDGEWVWREDTVHYVEHHGARLDDRFLEHVQGNEFTVPELSDSALSELEEQLRDFDFGLRRDAER